MKRLLILYINRIIIFIIILSGLTGVFMIFHPVSALADQEIRPDEGALTAAKAWGGTCGDGVAWSMGEDGLLTIRGRGAMDDFLNPRNAPWRVNGHVLNIERIQVDYGVSAIGNNAFTDCQNLIAVYLPGSVTSVGNAAFTRCYSLTDVILEEGLRKIGNHAFSECLAMREIILPESLNTIGQAAFSGCEGLDWISLGSNMKKIEPYSFKGCYSLSQADLTDNIITIGQEAFADCISMENLRLPRRVSDIGPGAFAGCASLSEIEIPATVTEIREGTFRDCGLKSVNLPNGIDAIGQQAFGGCDNLRYIYYAANRTRWNQIRMDDFRQQISAQNIQIRFADDSAAELPAAIENIKSDGWRVSVEISGEPGTGTTLFAAFYDAGGRFLGIRTQAADEARTYSVAEIPGAGRVKAFLLNPDGRPAAEAREQTVST